MSVCDWMVPSCTCRRIRQILSQEKVSGTLPRVAPGEEHTQKIQRGEEPLTSTKEGAMGTKRHSQRLAKKLKQTQKTGEMNQADAPTLQPGLLVALQGGSGAPAKKSCCSSKRDRRRPKI